MNINNHTLEIMVNGTPVDMYDEGINLRINKVINDPTKISSTQAEYSFTFNLPITPTNSKIFNYANISSKSNKFSGRFKCDVYADNIPIFEGTIKVSEVSEGSFKCNLFKSKVNTLESIFGDSTMNEINWKVPFKGVSTINEVNMDMESKYFFPLVAYSLFNKFPDITTGSGNKQYTDKYVIDNTNMFYYNSYIPSLNLVELLKKCCELKGYTLQGDILSDPVLNDIFLSNHIADEQDPLYNYGDNDMGETNVIINWKNYQGSIFDNGNVIEAPLDYIPQTRAEPLSGYNNYDTAFVWNVLSSTYSTVTTVKNNSKMYVSGGIQIPADGFYEITMDMDIGIPTTQGTIKAQQCTEYLPAYNGVDVNGNPISWDETRKYKDIDIAYSLDNMPIEIQLCKYDTDDGDVNTISHNLIYFGNYPNESDYLCKVTDWDTYSMRIGRYTNTTFDSLIGMPTIEGSPSAVAVDKYNNPDFVCGMSQSTYGRNFAYMKNGYSWHSDYQDGENAALYNMNGYNFIYTDFDLSTGIMGFTTGMTTSTVNQNELINGGAMYPTDNGRRTKGTLKTIVRLHKNDMLVPFAQTRGYYIEPEGSRTETSVIIDPVFYQADANINLRIRAVAPYLTQKTKLKYDMNSLFDVNLNLGNFNNQEQKISEFIENIQKAFNLSFQQDGTNIILNKNKLDKELTAPVDIDTKVNTMDATYTAIDFPKAIEVKWSIDTDEEGFYRSVEDNTTEEQMQSNNWKDYGDYGYEKVNVSNADDATDLTQSLQFSYNWYRPFTLANKVTNNDPITPEPDDTGTTSTHIVVTFTGKITRQSTNGDYGCDTNGDGIDDLYKPHSIVIESYVNYQISGVNIIPDDLKIEVESQKYHIGYEDKGYSAYTPTEMSGELRAPIPDTRINDQICNMIEQPTRIIGYDAYLEEGSEYTIEVIDNVEYAGFEDLSTFALTRATAPCTDVLSFAYNYPHESNIFIYSVNGIMYTAEGNVGVVTETVGTIEKFSSWCCITDIYSFPCIGGDMPYKGLFSDNSNVLACELRTINLETFNTSDATDMSYMFDNDIHLTSLNISNFDTSNVTNMFSMFQGCKLLPVLDVSSFDTSNVTDMGWMFENCSSLVTLDLSNFNTSNVTNMEEMFYDCESLKILNVTGWDVRNVQQASSMFTYCSSLEKLILGNVTKYEYEWWKKRLEEENISESIIECNIVDKPYMSECNNVLIYNGDIVWEADSQNSCDKVKLCREGESYLRYHLGWITPTYMELNLDGVKSYFEMFDEVRERNVTEIYKLPTNPNLTNTSHMFVELQYLRTVNFDCFETSNVTDMSFMFDYCRSLTELDLSSFNTNNVTDVSYMFRGCDSLTTLNVSSWDVNHITDNNTIDMLWGCDRLRTLIVKEGTEEWWCRRLTDANLDCSIINSVIPPVEPEPDDPDPDEPDKPEEEDPITPIGNVVYIPVIGKSEWWIEGYKYAEMAQNDGRGFKQRFWFRNKPTDAMLLTQGEQYRITTSSNYKKYDNGTVYLNYNNGVNTLLGRYFNIDVNSASDEVEIDVYLTPMEYKLISQGSSVHFDDNIYKVMEIQGYDPSGTNPTKLKLISM